MFFSNFAVMKKIIITIITTLLTLSTHAQLVQCEDTCQHVHGIDLSHYQGNVFWETVGDNTKMAYVYLKATEGGTNVDSRLVLTISTVLAFHSRHSSRTSWLNAVQAIRTCCP